MFQMLPKTGDAGGSEGGDVSVGVGDVSGGGKLSQGSSAADLLAAEFNFSFIFSDLPASNDIKVKYYFFLIENKHYM